MRNPNGVTGGSGVIAVLTAGMALARASDGAGIEGEWNIILKLGTFLFEIIVFFFTGNVLFL